MLAGTAVVCVSVCACVRIRVLFAVVVGQGEDVFFFLFCMSRQFAAEVYSAVILGMGRGWLSRLMAGFGSAGGVFSWLVVTGRLL